MHYPKTATRVILAVLLLFLIQPLCLATELSEDTTIFSEETEVSTDTAGSFAELTAWLDSHKKVGGTLQLENDIVIEADQFYSFSGWVGYPTSYIETGEYSIYVSGMLELYPYISIRGVGGENGVIHVEQGGLLMSGVPIIATEGCAIYQEEGAFLDISAEYVEGDIHFAEKPVAWPASDVAEYYGNFKDTPIVVLPADEEITEASFPKTTPAYICVNGGYYYVMKDTPVIWDLEQYAESLEKRQRVLVTGEFPEEISAKATPALLVTFLAEDSATFLQCAASRSKDGEKLFIQLVVELDAPTLNYQYYQLEYSADNENWYPIGDNPEQDDCILNYNLVFSSEEEQPRYFSMSVTDSTWVTRYSDTIELNADGKIQAYIGGGRNGEISPGDTEEDIGGGRDGETLPGDPEDDVLPPIVGMPGPPSDDSDDEGGTGGDSASRPDVPGLTPSEPEKPDVPESTPTQPEKPDVPEESVSSQPDNAPPMKFYSAPWMNDESKSVSSQEATKLATSIKLPDNKSDMVSSQGTQESTVSDGGTSSTEEAGEPIRKGLGNLQEEKSTVTLKENPMKCLEDTRQPAYQSQPLPEETTETVAGEAPAEELNWQVPTAIGLFLLIGLPIYLVPVLKARYTKKGKGK